MDLQDVALHYSTLAFRVRLAALTFVGAVLGASFAFFKEPNEANVVGTALILVVGALSALNYRYTHSYICACYAASALPRPSDGDLAADRWHTFRMTNERPYRRWPMRVLLSWSTYGPGILAGCYFILRAGYRTVTREGLFGLALAVLIAALWIILSFHDRDLSVDLTKDRGKFDQQQ